MMSLRRSSYLLISAILAQLCLGISAATAQTAPSPSEIAAYKDLLEAAHTGDADSVKGFIEDGSNLEVRDGYGRTPVIIAAFASHDDIVKMLAKGGADLDALENSAYDIVTIAAVADDIDMLDLALELGASAKNVTSRYDGTALIAAAHLGHYEVVDSLIKAGAPLDHINNLEWTALIESVVLGDGGPDHIETARLLIDAGANQAIGDARGITPFEHAKAMGYTEMMQLFDQ